MSDSNIYALNGALLDQQKLLQKLYSDLDVEREASATAASEALSMILRLQGQKAAVEMEASQYKRMAEEKMCHVENSLEMFDELIYHKEMEIASLQFQAQAYRYKLLSMGWTDVGCNDNRFPENLFPNRCDLSKLEMGRNQNITRMSSLPIPWKDGYQKGILKSSTGVPPSEAIPIIIEECFDTETDQDTFDGMDENYSTAGDIESYWEQIKKLDDRVKEISQSKCRPCEDNKYINSSTISSSTEKCSCHAERGGSKSFSSEIKNYRNAPNDSSSGRMTVVQDIFEVSGTEDNYNNRVRERSQFISKADLDTLQPHGKDQSEWMKKMLSSLNFEAKSPGPLENKKEVNSSEFHLGLQQLNRRIERLEKERKNNERSEIVSEGLGEVELNLLKEIREQLNSIQKDMRCLRSKSEPMLDEAPFVAVTEAMLHFWL